MLPKREFPLRQLYFYLTEGCNLACRHCWLSPRFDPGGDREQSLPPELFEQAILEAKALGLQGVKLTGGEPLLHPQFLDLLHILKQHDLALTVETNGILCTPEIAVEVASFPERFVAVSLDGADAVTHDGIRGVEGAFAQAQQAIEYLAAVETPPQVIVSLMRSNIGQVDSIALMAKELGASSVKFNIVEPTGRGEGIHKSQGEPQLDELIALGRHVEMELAPTLEIPLWFSYPLAFRPLNRLANGGTDTCHVLGILGVLATGDYALCGIGVQTPELVFGKVGEDRLEEVWLKNTTLQDLRRGLPERLGGICGRCLMKAACLGSCLAQNYYRRHDLWAPFWFCEQAEEQGLFPPTRTC